MPASILILCVDAMMATDNRFAQLRKQLSLGNIKKRIVRRTATLPSEASEEEDEMATAHLLEEVEPVSTMATATNTTELQQNSKTSTKTSATTSTECSDSANSSDGSTSNDDVIDKYKIPSSLVTLTEQEKRQLEDVLMRIGLRDCGL